MDWSRAKTILIVALIITNSLLVYVLFASGRTTDATLKAEFIQETIRLLNNKNIKIATDIPKEVATLNELYVEYEMLDPYKLNKLFFNGNGTIILKAEGLLEISYEDEIITIINKKHLIYKSRQTNNIYNITSEDEAVKFSLEFLEGKNFDTSDMKLSYIKTIDGVYHLEFTKIVDGNYLESTFTNIQINNNGIIEFKRQWLNNIDEGTSAIQITSAPKSILALLSMQEVYGRTIQDISLCYYFDPEKDDYYEHIDEPLEAKKGRAKPAWRVQFSDGHKVFIDN